MLNREKTKAKSFKQVQDFADTRFKRMLEFIVTRIRIEYAKPEEKIIKQDDGPQKKKFGDEEISGFFMYVVLNGKFCAELQNS